MATYLLFGDLQFEVLGGVRGIQFLEKAHYVEHEKIDKQPQLQRVGTELQEIRLTLRFHCGFCDPDKQMQALRDRLKKDEPEMLVFGSGVINGQYVLESIDKAITKTDAEGYIASCDVEVVLKGSTEPQLSSGASGAAGLLSFASPFLRG